MIEPVGRGPEKPSQADAQVPLESVLALLRDGIAAAVGAGTWVRVGEGDPLAGRSVDGAGPFATQSECWGFTEPVSGDELHRAADAVDRVGRSVGLCHAVRYVDRPDEVQMVAEGPSGVLYEFGGARRITLWAHVAAAAAAGPEQPA